MKYVYGILCHQMTNPLRFLISALCENLDSHILIHVDQKSDISPFLDEFSDHAQVQFIQNRTKVFWGSFSQIEAVLELLKVAQQYDYHYFSLLSGDDIPLQSISKFHNYLEKNNYEFIDLDRYPDCKIEPRVKYKHGASFFKKHRTQQDLLSCKWQRKLFKIGLKRNKIDHLPRLYKGSLWFTLSHSAIDYILEYLNQNPDYLTPFKTSLCGDEVFFHTIMFNSPFLSKIKTKDHMYESFTRYIDWKSGPDFPRTFDETDFEKIKSSDMFFARKVKYNISLEKLKTTFNI